jgi:hypothetical protein
MDAATVKAIFARKGEATQAVVALEFHVGQTVVSGIWTGKSHRSITGMPVYVPIRRRVNRTG